MCAEIQIFTPATTKQNEEMSLTFCVQFCKGQDFDIAIMQNDTCHCVATFPPYNTADVTNCSILCPGNSFQLCGGVGDFYSVKNG